MKTMKKLLYVILMLSLVICLFACGEECEKHVDEDKDGKCDECGETVELNCEHKDEDEDGKCDECGEKIEAEEVKEVILIDGGVANFQIIYGGGISAKAVTSVNNLKKILSNVGVSIDKPERESSDNVQDCEVIIGTVTTRGDEYNIDGHIYGEEGYGIKIVGNKVVITAGSDDMLLVAIEAFVEDILGIDEDTEELLEAKITSETEIEEFQEYRLKALLVDGVDMRDYTIAVDSNTYMQSAAAKLKTMLYSECGYWLEVVSLDKATDKSIVVKEVGKDVLPEGFKVSVNAKKQLVIECSYANAAEAAVENFLTDKIVAQKGEIDFKGLNYKEDVSVVYYSDFGAKGDGRTDDFFAIKAAHDYANISGQKVKADAKKYYISETREGGKTFSISVKTDTDWSGAEFTIDDSNIKISGDNRGGLAIFKI